ncbi:MAG: hypothetical protein KAX49_00770 [Halanaerobiales bacterium]|nr:hypothetical protein [Halanaerobiales bacterium]
MAVRSKKELQKEDKEFVEFNIIEYNMFWLLHLLIALLIISAIGGDVSLCLEKFLNLLNPANWF